MKFDQEELEKLHLFRRVAPESVWGLLSACPVVWLSPGELLLERGQSNQRMFLVLEGRLSVHLDGPDSAPIAYVERGSSVGEMSVIDDSPASAHVRAEQATRVVEVDEETFWRLVEASHAFSTNLLLLLAQRMRASNQQLLSGSRQRRQLEVEATVDALTGLHNRRWLEETLPRLVERHRDAGAPLSVILLDIDHFKRFNDDFGHAAGDRVLAAVGAAIRGRLRPTDLSARYGGEELVVILPATDLAGAAVAAERLREEVAGRRVLSEGRELPPVTVSLGVAALSGTEDAAHVLSRADVAMYQAKAGGRDRVVCWSGA
ncbi:MAG: GGDEF domain-containing protein [Deltaproteobacteria bacterium]|nr:GGDEF domain-containing protein [Deltaproteobacteria bacterium]